MGKQIPNCSSGNLHVNKSQDGRKGGTQLDMLTCQCIKGAASGKARLSSAKQNGQVKRRHEKSSQQEEDLSYGGMSGGLILGSSLSRDGLKMRRRSAISKK